MTINTSHPDCEYCKKLWDWAFLDDCFANNIRVTDIDGFVERNGHYLVIETKSPGVLIPVGQRRMFQWMQYSGSITVIIVWGRPQSPYSIEINHPIKGTRIVEPASITDLKEIVRGWFRYANTEPPPLRQPYASDRIRILSHAKLPSFIKTRT